MHIAIVAKDMTPGGAERVIAQLLTEWCSQDIECSLVLMENRPIFYKLPDKVNLYEIGRRSKNFAVSKFLQYVDARKTIRKIKPDIVLSMPEEIGIYIIGTLLGSRIPVVVSERNNPWVMPYKKITRLMRRITYPFATGLIFQTKQAASFFPKSQQKKGIVLPNPLDLSRIPEPYVGEREKIVVSAGRLETQKNFPLLIKAFSTFYQNHSDYKLVIYGEGSLRKELEKYAASLLPDSAFSFPGNATDLPERINKCSVFALSSDYEGIPNVLIEALAMGVPSVSTDCAPGGAAELIDDDVNGFLVPIGDEKALAAKMSELVDHTDIAERFSKESIAIKEKLDANIVCERWLDFLMTLSQKKKK